MDLAPDQPPEALHAVALFELQLNVEPAPLVTVLGLADRLMVGGCAVLTVTVVACEAEPPLLPMQSIVYVVEAVSAPLFSVPLVGRAPLQPPPAEHEAALTAFQVKVTLSPLLTVAGSALNETVARDRLCWRWSTAEALDVAAGSADAVLFEAAVLFASAVVASDELPSPQPANRASRMQTVATRSAFSDRNI